jgi:hypothetical protein
VRRATAGTCTTICPGTERVVLWLQVRHFVDDYEKNQEYTGFPLLGVKWQRMESDALKAYHGLKVRSKRTTASKCAWSGYRSVVLD